MFALPNKSIVVVSIVVAFVISAGFFLHRVYAEPVAGYQGGASGKLYADNGKVFLSAEAAAAHAALESTANIPMREVHIANNGLILLRGARVISISGSTIRVGMSWDENDFTWRLDTSKETKFLTSKGERETLTDIKRGDMVAVTGQLIEGGIEPAINARSLRE